MSTLQGGAVGGITVTIASGTALSEEIDVGSAAAGSITIPAGWDAANITLAAYSPQETAYVPVYKDDGNEYVMTVGGASRTVCFDGSVFALAGVRKFKIRSGTSGVPVNQTADRKLFVTIKR